MNFRIKRLGLSFVAIAAMAFTAASAAQAAQFHAEGGPNVNVTAQQTTPVILKLTNSSAETKCTQAQLEGTVGEGQVTQTTAEELTLTLTLTQCQSFGLSATADMNGCKLTVTGGGALKAVVDVTGCTVGKQIQITTAGCTLSVPEQTGINHVVAENNAGPPKDFEANVTLRSVTYQLSGALCPAQTGVTTQDGDLDGKVTFRAFADNGTEVATHNGHQYNKLKCGAQLGLLAT